MLPLRDAVSVLPHIYMAAAGAVVGNSTSTSPAKAVADTLVGNNTTTNINDAVARFVLSLLPFNNVNVRTLHAVLVASNLFWYQAIRQTVAVLSVFMCQEFPAMDTSQQAKLMAAPSVGNILTQAIGGLLLTWLPGGTKTAIAIGLIGLASGCTLLPLALGSNSNTNSGSSAPGSFPLGAAFGLLTLQGFLFGPMFPSHSVLLSKWLPPNERGSAMAYGEIAMSIASMGVPLIVTSIAEYTAKPVVTAVAAATEASSTVIAGWRNGFYVTGMACFGYLIAWIVLGRNEPESCSYISKKELDLIHSVQEKSVVKGKSNNRDDRDSKTSWNKILLHPSVLSLFFVHMVYNFVVLSINSWMPTYYNDVLKLNPNDAKLHIILPQLTALMVKLCVSEFARVLRKVRKDAITKTDDSGRSDERSVLLFSRRFMGYLGFLVMALPLFLLPMVAPPKGNSLASLPPSSSPWWSTGLFSVALAGTGFHAESFRANYLDVTQQHVGLVSGVGNCLSSVSAMLAPFVVGKIIKRTSGDWSPVWRLSALASLIAGLVFGSFSSTIPVEEQAADERR
jgi:sugar phosphate permease